MEGRPTWVVFRPRSGETTDGRGGAPVGVSPLRSSRSGPGSRPPLVPLRRRVPAGAAGAAATRTRLDRPVGLHSSLQSPVSPLRPRPPSQSRSGSRSPSARKTDSGISRFTCTAPLDAMALGVQEVVALEAVRQREARTVVDGPVQRVAAHQAEREDRFAPLPHDGPEGGELLPAAHGRGVALQDVIERRRQGAIAARARYVPETRPGGRRLCGREVARRRGGGRPFVYRMPGRPAGGPVNACP